MQTEKRNNRPETSGKKPLVSGVQRPRSLDICKSHVQLTKTKEKNITFNENCNVNKSSAGST